MAYTTNQTILQAIKQGDEVSWQIFYETYRPLIVFCGMQKLAVHEVDDLVQNVMLKVFNAQKSFNYSPEKGKFRDYLGRIIHNEIVNILRKRPREQACDIMPDYPVAAFDEFWQSQWQTHLFNQALNELKTRVSEITFQAFELYALQGMEPQKTAAFLGLKITQVYKAKLRCNEILQQIIKQLQNHE